MPHIAQTYALPRRYTDVGVIRYGFHGLSYEYVVERLRAIDPISADGRVVIAHLGNGASMAAIRNGRSIETTMGFSPTGGLVMSTRPGDLDPGVVIYLQREAGLTLDSAGRVLNKESGLLAVSETSGDMQDLLARESSDARAAEAIDLFCYAARKSVGALAAALGGLDALVFTGGIGEHASPVRARICAGLGFLGIRIDSGRNSTSAPIISPDDSRVTVRVIPTDEDLMIARHTYAVLQVSGIRDQV
jgi:acetate kinase